MIIMMIMTMIMMMINMMMMTLIMMMMIRAGAAPGRLVDLAGLVTWHGRWERESVTRSPAQSWVRLWLQVMDHTSDQVISVKMFVDAESWDQLEAAIPGEVIILTNLVSVFQARRYISGEMKANQQNIIECFCPCLLCSLLYISPLYLSLLPGQ